MKRADWYVVRRAQGITATTDIYGIREKDKHAFGGAIIPGMWFRDVSDAVLQETIIQGYEAIEAYNPSDEELPILWTVYPATMPKTVKVVAGGAGSLKNKWYKIAPNNETSIAGIAALCTVKGVCKAGEIAQRGDVIPAQWFSGLSIQQLELLENRGVMSAAWLNAQDASHKTRNKSPLLRYTPKPAELVELTKKFAIDEAMEE